MSLTEKKTETLELELTQLRRIIIALIAFQGILSIICFSELFEAKDNSVFIALIVVPAVLSLSIPFNYMYYKKIKKELASRRQIELSI